MRCASRPVCGLASTRGRTDFAEVILDYGADLFQRYGPGRTVLHLAAQDGVIGLIELFIKRGLDPNAYDEDGSTAAKWAAQKGHTEALKLMARLGVDISSPNAAGRGPLTTAVLSGNIDTVQYLLECGADPSEGGATPIKAALQRGNLAIAQLLLDHGAVLDRSSLHDATSDKSPDELASLRFCCEHGAAEDLLPPNDAKPYLVHLANTRQFEIATVLVAAGVEVSGLASNILSRLSLSLADQGLIEPLSRVIAAGANKNAMAAPEHWTILHIAAHRGHLDIIRQARAHGWDMQAEDRKGQTALHLAAAQGHLEAVEELLGEIGIHTGDRDGNSPLHLACECGKAEMISLLLRANAPLNKQNAAGWTALHWASAYGNVTAVGLLIESRTKLQTKDLAGNTALHYAALKNHVEIVNMLLTAGANVNARRADNASPLHLAASRATTPVVSSLIEAGADVRALNKDNESALDTALCKGYTEIAELLLADSRSSLTKTSLLHALRLGNSEIVGKVLSGIHGPSATGRAYTFSQEIEEILPELLADLLYGDQDKIASKKEKAMIDLLQWFPEFEGDLPFFNLQLLMSSIKNGDDTSPVSDLLERTPSIVNQVSINGWTPLHLACRHGRKAIIKVLLEYGAEPEAKLQGSGLTPKDMGRTFAPKSGVLALITRYGEIQRALDAVAKGT